MSDIVQIWQEIDIARDRVRPVVGDLTMTFDSADEVYLHALKRLNYPVKELRGHPNVAKAMFDAVKGRPCPQSRQAKMAADSAAAPRRAEMFPNANRLLRAGY